MNYIKTVCLLLIIKSSSLYTSNTPFPIDGGELAESPRALSLETLPIPSNNQNAINPSAQSPRLVNPLTPTRNAFLRATTQDLQLDSINHIINQPPTGQDQTTRNQNAEHTTVQAAFIDATERDVRLAAFNHPANVNARRNLGVFASFVALLFMLTYIETTRDGSSISI